MKHSVEDYVTVMVESEQDAFEETGFASFPSQETDEFQDLKSHLMSILWRKLRHFPQKDFKNGVVDQAIYEVDIEGHHLVADCMDQIAGKFA